MYVRQNWGEWFRTIIILAVVLNSALVASASISDWFWGNGHEKNAANTPLNDHTVKNEIVLPQVPFESLSNDERFLQEAQYFGLAPTSQLDICQQAVVLRLKGSCASLTEEQLAKLSVSLLNCQSAAEGRPQYPCSDDMSLRECTGDMDPDTWNTYHLMNNRARAVCLYSRQAQFRALTEMTVNKLMNTAKGQIDAMNVIQEGQEHLGAITEGTLKLVNEGQQQLLSQQQGLRAAQRNSHSFLAHSLKELAREKSIVAAGHRELARLAQNIKLKLDGAEVDLQQQNEERREQHEQLLSDLKNIQKQASEIWEDIDKSTHEILKHHASAIQHYEETLESLKAINSSILYLQNVLESTRKEVDQRLGWIADTLGGAGGQLDLVIACITHLAFLLLGMLTVAFLGGPLCTRVLLVLLVSLNVVQLAWQGPEAALSLPATGFLIVLGTGVHMLIQTLHHVLAPQRPVAFILPPQQQTNPTLSPSLLDKLQSTILSFWLQLKVLLIGIDDAHPSARPNNVPNGPLAAEEREAADEDESDSGMEELPARDQFLQERLRRLQTERNISRESTPQRRSRSGTPNRPSTPGRPHCSAICLNGQPCRLAATAPSGMCFRHARQSSNTAH